MITKDEQNQIESLQEGYRTLKESLDRISNSIERSRQALAAANESTVFWQRAYRKLSVEHQHLVAIIKKDGKGLDPTESLTTFLIMEGKYGIEG